MTNSTSVTPGKTKLAGTDGRHRADFVRHLMDDLAAMEIMLNEGRFETTKQRIGVEQEFCLIDYSLRPATFALDMLEKLNDEHFTTELAKFNLELNLDPYEFQGDCLLQIENALIKTLTKANKTAHQLGGKIILTGILPTVRNSDIVMANITPIPRYKALNDALRQTRGSDFKFYIRGIDELVTSHDTVLAESCNTSFQVHLQIDPQRFAEQYNWAQAISAPVLAASTNSPLFLGKRLWRETRIALFHQSTDYRRSHGPLRQEHARVTFGKQWETQSMLEVFRSLISRYKVLLTPPIKDNALQCLQRDETPALTALSLHNGTVYKWNRPCYGVTEGRPHIRIESRYLPAGPTIIDEVANAAFWLGLMNGTPDDYRNIAGKMDFDDVKANFVKAARSGLGAQFRWLDNKLIPAQDLILKELLPIAREGLTKAKINNDDIDRYLEIIEARVDTGRTGSQWILDSFSKLIKEASADEAIIATTEGIYQRQKLGHPVHKWQLTELTEAGGWNNRWSRIDQLMSTDLITVQSTELVELAKNILLWSNIRHIPVENADGDMVGLLSSEILLEHIGKKPIESAQPLIVSEIMERDPPTVTPDTLTKDALRLMREHEVTCLPVVADGKLVGIFTDHDCMKIARGLFEIT